MQKHTKIYMDYFGYDTSDFIPCELCGERAVDVNHIDSRGIGGSKKKDFIENLMAMCRRDHEDYGSIADDKEWLKQAHKDFMVDRMPYFLKDPYNF